MRVRLSILGQEIWSLQWCADCDCDEDDDDTPSTPVKTTVAGGETHNFERDTTPLDPADHYGEWEDRKRFGFGVRS